MAAASPIPMPETPSWRRFEIAIIGTARRLNTAFNDRVEPLDLNLNQASLLAFVVDFGDSTQTALADMVGLGRAATGTMIDHLEARGLLERRPDPADRRVWLVAATDAGRVIVEQFYEIDRALRGELRRGIGRDDRQRLAELLERLDANIDLAIANSQKNSPQR
jgi:MarR family transcriptional regulator for hemolysin